MVAFGAGKEPIYGFLGAGFHGSKEPIYPFSGAKLVGFRVGILRNGAGFLPE